VNAALADVDPHARPEIYPLSPSARPAHVVVRIPVGDGLDSAALSNTLRAWRKQMARSGATFEIKRRAGGYVKPGDAKRRKSLRARRRQQKNARRVAQRDAWAEAHGR
jgi:ribosomal protein S21